MTNINSDILESRNSTTTIDCGIGEIKYINPDNLLLVDLMENLEEAIKKTNPKRVNEVLQSLI